MRYPLKPLFTFILLPGMDATIPEIVKMDELITVVIGLLILRNVYTIFPAKSSFVHLANFAFSLAQVSSIALLQY